MDNDLRVDYWNGEVEYHTYKQKGWYAVGGPQHPLFRTFISRIISESKYVSEYKLYVIGGVLEEWLSWDIDFAITGEYNSYKLKEVFETILRIGYDLRIFPDMHFQESLWRVDLYSKDELGPEKHDCWRLSNVFARDGEYQDLSNFVYEDGLYKQSISYPFPKHVKRKEEGYVYKKPLLLN
jgi:hypothetical protein|tara:strand:+ start:4262 stop:4804 length:543 start_codon:yes stop_codon:yes gene_type:complete